MNNFWIISGNEKIYHIVQMNNSTAPLPEKYICGKVVQLFDARVYRAIPAPTPGYDICEDCLNGT